MNYLQITLWIIFQAFGEDTGSAFLILYLFLGFSGFFLLVLLFSIVFITVSDEDQILIDTEEIAEAQEDIEHDEKHIKGVKQSRIAQSKFFFKPKSVRNMISETISHFVNFPFSVYSCYLRWAVELDNDLISIP